MLVVPLYAQIMGIEAYGLIAFFMVLQGWLQLLDLGLSPTLMRESARFSAGASSPAELRRLLRTLETLFLAFALLIAIAIILGAGWIAAEWLNVEALSVGEVEAAVAMMGPALALRFAASLHRSLLTGFERIVWLSAFTAAVSTARFVLVLPVLAMFGASPQVFFAYQLGLALIETSVLASFAYRLLPQAAEDSASPSWSALRPHLRFALSIAFTGSVWVLVTQIDKLLLSSILRLEDYAMFSLAAIAAGGVLIISTPISGALVPRLTHLHASQDEAGFILIYRRATQLVAATAIPAALTLAVFPEQLLWAWTGDAGIARAAAPVLTLYALGNGVLAISGFGAYSQIARGDVKLLVIGCALLLLFLIPAIVVASLSYGAVGAGAAWLSLNVLYLLLFLPLIHRRLAPSLHARWLVRDVLAIAAPATAAAALARHVLAWPNERFATVLLLLAVGCVLVIVGGLASPWLRDMASGVASRLTKAGRRP